MKKICLVVVGLYLSLLSVFSQSNNLDDSVYKSRKLKLDEINFVNSYYHQNGNHSAITGGIGTQLLSDYANEIDLTFIQYDKRKRNVNWDVDLGLDYYTSASSDKIDPSTISSASAHDFHFYPSIERTVTNEKKRTTLGFGISTGVESNYFSRGFDAAFTKKSKNKNRELEVKMQCYLDEVKIILPIEQRDSSTGGLPGYHFHDYPWIHRNSFSTALNLSQAINKRLQVLFSADVAYQQGFLSLPYHRVYFSNGLDTIERLPSHRFKIPLGIRFSYFLGDKFIIRSFYRFYHDDWGLNASTIDNEIVIKLTPFFSVAPFYRYYVQNAIHYFAPDSMNAPTQKYFSSDYDLSAFHSSFFGTGFRIAPIKGILGHPHWNMVEIRYGHYAKNIEFNSNIISVNLKFDE